MVAVYITSAAPAAGKTTVAAGLAKHWQAEGKKVGYFQPLTAPAPRRDALFMKQVLALSEAEDVLSPVISELNSETIKQAYARVAGGKDIVLVEGAAGNGKSGLMAALDARVILLVGYAASLPLVELVAGSQALGPHLLSLMVNKVPRSKVEKISRELSLPLSGTRINFLGVLPEDRTLAAVTVAELAAALGGEILNNNEKSVELVENFMIGALGVDSGLAYFGRKGNKAVIARAGRPDIHLAALETPMACLVVTGNKAPAGVVLHRAEEKQVPVIQVKEDVDATMARIDAALGQSRFSQEKKMPRLMEIMAQRFDFKVLETGLGLAG